MPTPRKLTFDNLIFEPLHEGSKTLKATLTFKNNYGCNVYMHSPATNKWLPYEFELLYNGRPTAHPDISDDNVGYSSKDDISEYISIAQKL